MNTNPQMVQIEVLIPEDVYLSLKMHGLTREQIAQQARHELALHLFREHVLSLGKAAKLAGMNLWDFTSYVSRNGIPVVDLDEDEFAHEMATLEIVKSPDSQASS